MPFDGYILGNKLIILHPCVKEYSTIQSQERFSESASLKAWNGSVWSRAPSELKGTTIEQIHVRESAFTEVKKLIESARAQGNYLIFSYEEFKRTVFINHATITKRDIEKVFQCKVSIRKRGKRELLIFYPEPP